MDQPSVDKSIFDAIQSEMKAITVMRANNLHSHALSNMYAAIDRMAWLSHEPEKAGGAEFQGWLDAYFFAGDKLPYGAVDLWAARCGLLHTGAAESDLYRGNNAKLIYYTNKTTKTREEIIYLIQWYLDEYQIAPKKLLLIDYHELILRFFDSLERFRMALLADSDLHQRATRKANRLISFRITT